MLTYVEDRFAADQNSNHLADNNVNHNSNPRPGNYKDDHMYSNQYN